MKIRVRFEDGTQRADAEEFLKSLGLDLERWLEEQTFDTEGRGPAEIFGMQLPLDVEELAEAETWICSIYEQEGSKRFGIGGQLIAADILGDYDLHEVLAVLPNSLRRISLTNLSVSKVDEVLMEVHPGLTSLNLSGCKSLSDLSGLSALTGLTSLNLSGCKSLSDLSGLSGLTGLTSLNLSGCESLSDLSGLSGLTGLTSLNLSGYKFLSDPSVLSGVSGLSLLTSLNLSFCESLSDVSGLSMLRQLTSLDLTYCESITNVNGISNLRKLRLLNLSFCRSLTDVSGLLGLSQLTSLNLWWCVSLTDVSVLSGLSQLTTLNLSRCKLLNDVSVLSGLSQLTKLNMSSCKALTDVGVLSGLSKLTELNLSECDKIKNIEDLSSLPLLSKLEINGLSRLRSIEPLRDLAALRDLSGFHPAVVAEVLAHTAMLRSDKDHISKKSGDWLQEAIAFTDGERPEQERFATSLGEAFCLLGKHAIELPYEAYLQSKPDFSSAPWKAWLEGTGRQSGSELMRRRIERQDIALSTPGCIGGICAVMPDQSSSDEDQAWGRDRLAEMEAAWQTRSKELLPVSAEVCLAHARLGLQRALECWLERFTDSSDPAALDPVQAALGQWQLDQNDTNAALHHAMAIHQPQVRDPLLGRIVERCHSKEADLAGRTLLMITDEALAGRLASSLAQDEIFVATASNVERLIVSCGTSALALAELIGQISPAAEATPLQALSARLQSSPETARDLRRSLLLRLIDEI